MLRGDPATKGDPPTVTPDKETVGMLVEPHRSRDAYGSWILAVVAIADGGGDPRSRSSPLTASHPVDFDVLGVAGKSPKVFDVPAQYRSAGLGAGHDDRVNGGSLPCRAPQGGCPAGEVLGEVLDEVAGLEEAVDHSVTPLPACERFDEDDRRDDRRPDAVAPEHGDHRRCFLTLARQAADPTRVEDEHAHEAADGLDRRRIRRDSASARCTTAGEGSPTVATSSSR